MSEAMRLAAELGCVLVALCSKHVSAYEVEELGEQLRVSTLSLDTGSHSDNVPALRTSSALLGTPFERASDLSHKCNLGLILARVAGWSRVLYLDDDMYEMSPRDVGTAVAMLDNFDAVGLRNAGFPDNSVVCHAFRAIGGDQEQFVGSGSMALRPAQTRSFFPDIYNQDWLFLIGERWPPKVAVTGAIRQAEFDPFGDPDRARSQEFGDCLAEGVYWLLDDGQPLERANRAHWRLFLRRRRRFIDRLLVRVRRVINDPDMRARMVASLEAAQDTNAQITPEFCAEYLALWRSDLQTWRRHLDELPVGVGVERALRELDLCS